MVERGVVGIVTEKEKGERDGKKMARNDAETKETRKRFERDSKLACDGLKIEWHS